MKKAINNLFIINYCNEDALLLFGIYIKNFVQFV